MIIIWIIVAIIVFSIIILIHEYWHFKASRIFWVKVEEFGLWIPPKAKEIFTDKKWTKYTLNWLPLGWFVKLKWENINTFRIYDENKKILSNQKAEDYIKNSKDIYDIDWNILDENIKKEILQKLQDNYANDSLLTKNPLKQAIIVLAWIFMNFLLAFVIFFVLFLIWVKPIWVNNSIPTNLDLKFIPTLEKSIEIWLVQYNSWILLFPANWSIAQKSWIKNWDILYEIYKNCDETNKNLCLNGNKDYLLKTVNDPQELINIFNENKNSTLSLYLNKNLETNLWGKFVEVTLDENGKIWSYISKNLVKNEDFEYKYSILDSAKYALLETKNQISFTFSWIKMLLGKIIFPKTETERQEAINEVSWPIWMVDFMSKTVGNWIIFVLIIWALISINLWVFNLLPIPALDWWRFIFIVINWIIQKIFWRKAINENLEWLMHVLFFIFLIALSIIIAYNDVVKIINN